MTGLLAGGTLIGALPLLAAAATVRESGPAPRQEEQDAEPPATPAPRSDRAEVSADSPLRVSFRLADGVRVSGDLTGWDEEGIDGTFGRRRWVDLMLADVRRLLLRLMDKESAADWVLLGGVMLKMDGGADWAERAFREALRLDENAAPLISRARDETATLARERERLERAVESERLATLSPEAREWPATPWPTLGPDEQQAAEATMRARAREILQRAGLQPTPISARHFLVYSDLPRREAAVLARRLDQSYLYLSGLFGLPADVDPFWGKAVVFLFKERDPFRLIEAQSFGHLAAPNVSGIGHQRGPQVFINVYRRTDDRELGAVLLHEAVHAFMHRYQTPRRLPTWANEGLAQYVAAQMLENSIVDEERRPQALAFIRSGGPVDAVLALNHRDGSWPGPQAVGEAVGHLLVELMIAENPRGFVQWVDAVKAGKPWEQALREDFGASRENLIAVFVQYYTVND